MQFTYDAYKGLLEKLKSHGYQTANYTNWDHYDRCVILRHDIDNDIEKAVEMASLERDGGGGFDLLCSSDFRFLQYLFSKGHKRFEKDSFIRTRDRTSL